MSGYGLAQAYRSRNSKSGQSIKGDIRVPAGRGIFTRLLQSYGKASPNIWLLHYTLISISYEFFPFTSRRDYIMQFLIVAAASLPISIALNKLKDVTRFNRAIKQLRSIVD